MKGLFKKTSLISILLIYGLLNVILFVIITSKMEDQLENSTFWFVWAFTFIVNYLGVLGCSYLAKEKTKNDFVNNMPLYFSMYLFSFIYILLGMILMFIPSVQFTLALILEAIVSILYIVTVLFLYNAISHIKSNDEKQAKKVFYIRNLQTEVDFCLGLVKENENKKLLIQLQEAIRYSDPMSDDSLESTEQQIELLVNRIKNECIVSNEQAIKELVDNLLNLIKYRNEKVKQLK